jgi:hypothetical protein
MLFKTKTAPRSKKRHFLQYSYPIKFTVIFYSVPETFKTQDLKHNRILNKMISSQLNDQNENVLIVN